MTDLLNFPELVRNIAVVGHLHHGKTSFVDMLVAETHDVPINVDQPVTADSIQFFFLFCDPSDG